MWRSTLSMVMIGFIDSLNNIVSLKSRKFIFWRAYQKMLSTHRAVTTTTASKNHMNGGTRKKKGRKVREKRKRDIKWTNKKERGEFRDSWDYFLLPMMVSIILIDRICCNFDCWIKIKT